MRGVDWLGVGERSPEFIDCDPSRSILSEWKATGLSLATRSALTGSKRSIPSGGTATSVTVGGAPERIRSEIFNGSESLTPGCSRRSDACSASAQG